MTFEYVQKKSPEMQKSISIIKLTQFQIVSSLFPLYESDHQLRDYIASCLQQRDSPLSLLSSPHVTFELAICYKLGFGVDPDDENCRSFLKRSGRTERDLEQEIRRARFMKRPLHSRSVTFLSLTYADREAPFVSAGQGFRSAKVEKSCCNIKSVEALLGIDHEILLFLKLHLSVLLKHHGQIEEAEELQNQILKYLP